MRIRTIKPEFFKHEEIASLPAITRILFQGLWCMADRRGRLEDRPKRIKAEVLPYDEIDIEVALNALHHIGAIERYSADGISIIQVVNFEKHQRINGKEALTESAFQAPKQGKRRGSNGEAPVKLPGINWEATVKHPGSQEGKGRERKGMDLNLAAPPAPRARNELLDALCLHAELTDPSSAAPALWSKLAMALKEIKGATPDVTAVDIGLRAQNYRSHFRDATISATALAKHWGRCAAEAPVAKSANAPVPWQRDSHNSDHEKGF